MWSDGLSVDFWKIPPSAFYLKVTLMAHILCRIMSEEKINTEKLYLVLSQSKLL